MPALVEANSRRGDHWAKKKKRKDDRVYHTLCTLRSMPLKQSSKLIEKVHGGRMVVRLVSISVQKPDDDNLAGALKHYRDAVAFWLRVPDEDPRILYVPKWERYRGLGVRGVRIEFVDYTAHLKAEHAQIEAEIAALAGEK